MTRDLLDGPIIQRGLLLGLGWLNEHLHQFSVPPVDSHRFDKRNVARLKPISELALTMWVLRRCGLQLPFLDTTAAWIWQQCEQGRKLVSLLLARNDFLPCCALYAPLFQLGYRNRALHHVLGMLSRSDMAVALPLQPWSRLAMHYNLWQLGLSHWPNKREQGLYVEACPEPWVVSGEVAYAITHEVFYLTDFGARPLDNEAVADYLQAWVPYWTKAFVAEANNDLAAEFAMVSACLQTSLDDGHAWGLLTALGKQSPSGAVPGPDGAGSFLFADDDTAERRHFLSCYHTTLVMLMAAALTLHACSVSTRPVARLLPSCS